jgi:hypothetical protein
MDDQMNNIPRALHLWWRGATAVAAVAAIASCVVAIHWKNSEAGKYLIAFGWSLVPPLWFIFERHYLIRKYGEPKGYLENADLAFKFWAGVAALLVFLYA